MFKRFLTISTTLTLCSLGIASGETIQSLDAIGDAARRFVIERAQMPPQVSLEVTVDRLDPRLRLAACGMPLEAFLPSGGRVVGDISVGVRCPGPKPWSLYVPVSANLFGDVVIAGRSLPRGTVIKKGDFQIARRQLMHLRNGYFFDQQKVIGMVLKRQINPGMPLQANQLREPTIVRRGEKVTLIAETGGIEVRMSGEAITDGALGDIIRVRNSSSRRIVEGVVTRDGAVKVRL